jgi:diaminopimelate decarboxylase
MSNSTYERPVIVKNPAGLMHKAGRRPVFQKPTEVSGIHVDALRRAYGSPLFVFSERKIRSRVREARAALSAHVPNVQLCWSYKTNYLDAICAVFHQEGSWAEVVSGMEYEKARRLGVPGSRIVFNGPAKTYEELERAVREGALIHADHFEELQLLERVARDTQLRPTVGIRVALDAGIYPRWDRFGFGLESGQAMQAVRSIVEGGWATLGGLHTHIGTFILDPAAYARAGAKLADLAAEIEKAFGVAPTHLDLGGGLPSSNTLAGQYHSGATLPPLADFAAEIGQGLASSAGRKLPVFIEAGRALIDDAGTLLATVIASKKLSGGKRAIVIDAGVNLLFTAWWYKLEIAPALEVAGPTEDTIVYGPLCMNIDCVRESIALPELRAGDPLTIHPVGAYTFTQSMQFIHLRPACVLIDPDGTPQLIRRAEKLEDLSGPELLPSRLRLSNAAGQPSAFLGSSPDP